MLVCNVSLRPRHRAIAADIAEAAAALDASTTGTVVFATLVDDPANVRDTVDAYFGEIMLEAASASETADAGFAYDAAIVEVTTGVDVQDASATAATTTWNPSDKSANITLSGGNLTVQASTSSDGAVRSTSSKISGKLYFEIDWTGSSGTNTGCGICTAAANLSTLGPTSNNGAILYGTGGIWVNGTNLGIGLGSVASGTVCFAIDLTNSRFWTRINAGNWNASGTANPATNTGGVNIAALTSSPIYACTTLTSATSANTANFGGSTFQQAIPSGFVAWS
jgi:hypothetical protein